MLLILTTLAPLPSMHKLTNVSASADLLESLEGRCAGIATPRAKGALELPSSCADRLSSRDALSACLAEPGSPPCPVSGLAWPGLCSAVIKDPLALGSSASDNSSHKDAATHTQIAPWTHDLLFT